MKNKNYGRQPVQINNNFVYIKKLKLMCRRKDLFINDFVLLSSQTFLSNNADDNNLFSNGKELDIIKEKLRKDFKV